MARALAIRSGWCAVRHADARGGVLEDGGLGAGAVGQAGPPLVVALGDVGVAPVAAGLHVRDGHQVDADHVGLVAVSDAQAVPVDVGDVFLRVLGRAVAAGELGGEGVALPPELAVGRAAVGTGVAVGNGHVAEPEQEGERFEGAEQLAEDCLNEEVHDVAPTSEGDGNGANGTQSIIKRRFCQP